MYLSMAALMLLLEQNAARMRRERVFRDRLNPLDYLNDTEIIERYRLPRNFIFDIVDMVRPDIERSTARSHSLPTTTQVLVTLRCLSKGIFYSEAGDLHGVSKASVCRSMEAVLTSICRNLNNIKFPTSQEDLIRTKRDLFKLAKFPNCIGAIDGTLIKIQAPHMDEADYVCRKGYHALNVQAVADSSLRFTNLVCRWPGSVHDAFVLQNSELNDRLNNGFIGWLLGDSGYPLKPYLMTPILHPRNDTEIKYNSAHCRTRVCVERAFGVLKSRFRCLHPTGGVLPFSTNKCIKVIVACFKLHNKCIKDKLPNPDIDQEEEEYNNELDGDEGTEVAAQEIRRQLVQRFV